MGDMEKKSKALSWGIIFAVNGINIVAMAKYATQSNSNALTMLMMMGTVALLLMSEKMNDLLFWRMSKPMAAIVLYSFATVLLALFSSYNWLETPSGVVYQLYNLVLILLIWHLADKIDTEHFMWLSFYINGILAIVALIVILKNGQNTGVFFSSNIVNASGETIFSRDTTAGIGLITFITVISYQNYPRLTGRVMKSIFLIISVIVMILANRRTVLLNALLVLVLHWHNTGFKCRKISKRTFQRVIVYFAVGLALCYIFMKVPMFRQTLDKSMTSLSNGIQTFLGNASTDLSTEVRRNSRVNLLHKMQAETNVYRMILGHGYMTAWIDFPYLQAFWELGFIGGIVYLILQLFLPLQQMISRQTNPCLRFAQYLVSIRIISNLASGTCYGVFFPVALMLALTVNMSNCEKKEGKKYANISIK